MLQIFKKTNLQAYIHNLEAEEDENHHNLKENGNKIGLCHKSWGGAREHFSKLVLFKCLPLHDDIEEETQGFVNFEP